LALVEFLEVGEARRAFRGLAYSKLRGAPLFLEWAPTGLLEQVASRPAKAEGGEAEAAPEAEADGDAEGCTIFVKNLNFKTDRAALHSLFAANWRVRSTTIVQRRDRSTGGSASKPSSMGYGFVELHSAADAQVALRQLSGVRLDDHVLQLKLSSRPSTGGSAGQKASTNKAATASSGKAKRSSKLLVRNVPFEAKKRELRELFSAFGQLKTVRVPKRFDGVHRGFAFIEFMSKAEATKAFDALQNTHIYGRHLVLEYAAEEASVEAMREKLRAATATISSQDHGTIQSTGDDPLGEDIDFDL